MNLPKCWIKQLKNYAFQLAKVNTHVLFLDACLNLNITPIGLTSKPPLSGMPQHMWPKIIQQYKSHSLDITKTVLNNYKSEQSKLSTSLISISEILLTNFPHLTTEIHKTIQKANKLQEDLAGIKLKKLSNLCLLQFKQQGFIEKVKPAKTKDIPLIGDKPSLASLLNLPTPNGQLPYLPKAPLLVNKVNPARPNSEETTPTSTS